MHPDMAKLIGTLCLIAFAGLSQATAVVDKRATGGYVQSASGSASFTMYTGCGSPGTCHRTIRSALVNFRDNLQRAESLRRASPLPSASSRSAQRRGWVQVMLAAAALRPQAPTGNVHGARAGVGVVHSTGVLQTRCLYSCDSAQAGLEHHTVGWIANPGDVIAAHFQRYHHRQSSQ